ncbi:MAG: hypothetical protein J5879_04000 [Clostridia bacterium]|nr:hypothetical protein [Clostridia bacterium]
MKRIIALLLTAIMCAAFITGCTETPEETTGTAAVTDTTEPLTEEITETETETEAMTEETTEEETLPVVTEDLEAMNAEPATKFTVSRAFGNNMVIQRNEYIRIWGWADEAQNGKRVEAEFGGLHGAAVITDGEWLLTLGGTLPENTEGQTLRVFGAEGMEYKFENVLVGDVYWVIGQSNIWYPVSYILTEPKASEEAKNVEISDDLQIRLNRTYAGDFGGIQIGTDAVSKNVVNRRGWQMPTKGANDFSAVGYFTAIMMYNQLDRKVPMGMIEFDGNGCALHAFLPNEVRDALNVSTKSASGIYSAAGVNAHVSSFMYNHGMYAFQNMPIKGVIWYQGESDLGTNNNNCTEYANRFKAFVEYIRNAHDQIHHDYPVYMVELPPIFIAFDFSDVRLNMGTIPSICKNVHISTSADLWKDKTYGAGEAVRNNLHPYNKWEVSQRMSSIILADMYGIGDLDYTEGPVPMSYEVSDDGLSVTVKFVHVGDGLTVEGDTIKGFRVITEGKNRFLKPSSVQISGVDTVTVTAAAKITAVAYNTSREETFPEKLTLCSSSKVPCASFQFNVETAE